MAKGPRVRAGILAWKAGWREVIGLAGIVRLRVCAAHYADERLRPPLRRIPISA